MSTPCGSGGESLDGKVITNASIVGGTITNAAITGGSLNGVSLSNITSIDAVTAGTLVDAIAQLPPSRLQALVDAVIAAMGSGASMPPSTQQYKLPTYIVGNRQGLLGNADSWINIAGLRVPAYNPT